MAPTPRPECLPCKRLVLTLTDRGLVHWLPQDTPDFHFMTTEAASRARQSAHDDRLAPLRDQIDAIHEAGRVAWIDVTANGDFVLYQAPHGQIPADLPHPAT
jgi:hypothetical protein